MAVYAMPPAKLAGNYDWTREMVIVPEKDKAAYEIWGAVSDDYIMPA